MRWILSTTSVVVYLTHCSIGPRSRGESWLSFSPEVVTSLSDRSIINTLSSQDKSAKDFPRRFWRENKYIGFCGEHLRGVIYSGREEYIRVFVTKEENFSLRNWSLCGSTYKGKLGFKYRIQKKENNVKSWKTIRKPVVEVNTWPKQSLVELRLWKWASPGLVDHNKGPTSKCCLELSDEICKQME